MKFRYRAFATDRNAIGGVIEASSEEAAEEALYLAGFEHILSLKEARLQHTLGSLVPTLFGAKPTDVIDFSRQLATLLESGVPLMAGLQLLESHTSKAAFREVIAALTRDLHGGSSLSQALSGQPAFPSSYCQVVQASEQAGTLEAGLRQVADHMEKRLTIVRKIRRALTYPAAIILMAIGVIVLLVTVVLPPLLGMFGAFDVELPWTTRLVISTTDLLTDYGAYLLGILALLGVSVIVYARTPAGRLTLDQLTLRMPLIGPVAVNSSMFHFCQSASTMLRSGLQLTRVMEIAVEGAGNRVVREALREVQNRLMQGEGLAGPLADNPVFPPMLVQMVALGESTGNMDSALSTMATYYEERVDQRISGLVSMLEPALTLGIGLLVAFMAIAIVLPLYSIMGSIG